MGLVRTKTEIENLKKAANIGNKIFAKALKRIKNGASEKEIAQYIEEAIKERGLTRSFKTIVASGPNSAKPHAKPTDRRIKKNDVVVVDFGVVYRGYHSDMTRTLIFGKVGKKLKGFYKAVFRAQKMAIKMIKPGVRIAELTKLAHNYLRSKGFEKNILHTLGHGIGKKIHQAPKLSEKNRRSLKKNMVITIEPGLYQTELGGVRIEDMVLVTENGSKILT